jgi:hypothetical protein
MRLAVLLTAGEIPGGTIRTENGTALLAVFPLDRIDRAGALNSAEDLAKDPPRRILVFDSDDFAWGELRISTIIGHRTSDIGHRTSDDSGPCPGMRLIWQRWPASWPNRSLMPETYLHPQKL